MAGYGCPLPSFLMVIAMVSSWGFAVWRERQTWRHVARQLEEAAAGLIPEIDIRERVSVSAEEDKAGVGPIERPGRREAARCYLGRHSTPSEKQRHPQCYRHFRRVAAGRRLVGARLRGLSPSAKLASSRKMGGSPHARCNRRNGTGARVRFPCFGRW